MVPPFLFFMDQNYYKYENEVNFNIDVIKEALKSILKANPVRFIHEEKDLNDTLGTYSFGEIKCAYMVTLSKIDEDHTKIVINCSSRQGGFEASMASLANYTNEFLAILTAKLDGASEEEMKDVVRHNNSDSSVSCITVIITIIAIATIIWIFIN
jgi:UDP-N-acetylmuramyl pentapeptide synthase